MTAQHDAHPIPITVVSGFLGAGKTTFLNNLLRQSGGRRLAVLVNDFGELNIDESLIAEVTDNVQALTNGCICCSMQGELIQQVGTLATRQPPPEHILIECSGVSEPARIVRTLGYPELRRVARLDSVTTIVDPTTLADLDGEYADLARSQIGSADLLVLNKTDLVQQAALDRIRAQWLPGRRPSVEAISGRIPPELIFDSDRDISECKQPITGTEHSHGFATWQITLAGMFQLKPLRRAFDDMPTDIFRIKGHIKLAERPDECFWLHWVGGRTDIRSATKQDGLEDNLLVVISRHNDALPGVLHKQLGNCIIGTGLYAGTGDS